MYARYVYVRALCCTIVTAQESLLGEPEAVCSQYVARRAVSSSSGLYAICLTALSGPQTVHPQGKVIAGFGATVMSVVHMA